MGSSAAVLDALVDAMQGTQPQVDRRWLENMQRADRENRQNLLKKMSTMPPGKDGAMHPYRLLGCLRAKLNRNAVVIADGGDFLCFSRLALTGAAYLDCGPFGCLGVGVPFGIAASPDSKSGLAIVPDTQALTAWDELEKARRKTDAT